MNKILKYLFEHKTLSAENAKQVLMNISRGIYSESEIASFATVFLMRSITIAEVEGFSAALMELCVPVNLKGREVIDLVGTGGDGKNTFNISTLSTFIVAGAGISVAKHGNYGATSISGSSNVMENLGYRFSADNDKLLKELDETNVCFMHAPLFHPALKQVASVRKSLGVRTFFNMLGPLVNPARPQVQLLGVFNLEMARIYTYLFQQSGKKFMIVHSLDGYDEISLTNDTKIITNAGEKIVSAQVLGKHTVSPEEIYGGNTPVEAAKIFISILQGNGSVSQDAVVIANSAMAIHAMNNLTDYETCYEMASESLKSGKAYKNFLTLMSLQS
ncbi:MAG: anthranilate phosphoribosyltransferase [Ginsengibacter sp.]